MLDSLLEELIVQQRKKMLSTAERIVGRITEEDLLQPNDFPALENHPFFRYEEGVLEGLMTAQMAYRAWQKDCEANEC
jgi:hypothetical protein